MTKRPPTLAVLLLAVQSAGAFSAARCNRRLKPAITRVPVTRRSSASMMMMNPITAHGAAAVALKLKGGSVGVGSFASVIPPVATLAVALLTKQVAVALLCGIFSGCMLLYDLNPAVAMLRCFDTFIINAIADKGHTTVILFNLILGGTIGLVQKGGGALGLAQALKRFAKDAQSCLATTVALAALIFFDDYASILIVGNSFRPLLPMLNVCKAKFAALLHFVAVAVSASMPVSSWIGLQVGSASTATAGILASGAQLPDPFMLTLKTLPYRFFPLSMLAFVLALVATDKDIGPMADAVRATNTASTSSSTSSGMENGMSSSDLSSGMDESPGGAGALDDDGSENEEASGPLTPKPGTPLRAVNALVPFGAIVAVTLGGMVFDGKQALVKSGMSPAAVTLVKAISSGDSVLALLWGSTAGMLTAMGLLLRQNILNLGEVMGTLVDGMRDVMEPIMVLTLAWALGAIIGESGTADFIAKGLLAGGLPAWGLPCIASLLSYVISFATGSSFGTMGILFPLIGPLAWALGGGSTTLLLHCFGSVYGGSLFGNMFSPIADTSILTSLACRINLQEHVTTAGPYACLVGLSCLLLGDLPVGLGVYGPFAALGVIWTAQTAVLSFFGKRGLPKAKTAPGAAPGTPQVAV